MDWNTHVVQDHEVGFALELHMNEDQTRSLAKYNRNQWKNASFPTTISLPFWNKRKLNWYVKTRWNGEPKIYTNDALWIASQFEEIFMPFIVEASKRKYLQFNEFDPVNFYYESLHPIPQISINTYVQSNNTIGRITDKLYHQKHIYQWNVPTINIYQIQLVDPHQSILTRSIVLTDEHLDVPVADISVYREDDVLYEVAKWLSIEHQTLSHNWNMSIAETREQIVSSVAKFLRHKCVNHTITEKKCNVVMKRVEFEKYLLVECSKENIVWDDSKVING